MTKHTKLLWALIIVMALIVIIMLASLPTSGPGPETSPRNTQYPQDQIISQLPECVGQRLSIPPIDLNDVYEISPLGSINPPDHTLPTPHLYLHLGQPGGKKIYPLKAPGEVYITELSGTKDLSNGEWTIKLGLCKDVFIYFGHVKELSNEIQSLYRDVPCQVFSKQPENSCTREKVHKVATGTLLGGVGALQENFDFGAYDYREILDFANPSRYGDTQARGFARSRLLSTICPIDLYNETWRANFYKKIRRSTEPKCGVVMQDMKGTLQGAWFYETGSATLEWEKQLSFSSDSNDPNKAVIAIGGIISEPAKLTFNPSSTGFINRKFTEVKPDGNIYCYFQGNNRIIVMMLNKNTIKIEHRDRNCKEAAFAFSNPKLYRR